MLFYCLCIIILLIELSRIFILFWLCRLLEMRFGIDFGCFRFLLIVVLLIGFRLVIFDLNFVNI